MPSKERLGLDQERASSLALEHPARRGQKCPIKLQKAALRAFRAAERAYGKATDRPKEDRPIKLTGSWRSCSHQRELFAGDPKRFADPDVTGHTRGIAIDVSTAIPNQAIIARCLRKNGWTQTRPEDEPWHWSYGVTV